MSGWTWVCSCGKGFTHHTLESVQEAKSAHHVWHAAQVRALIKEAEFPPMPGYDAPV